jgi:hypothetical protein
VARFVCSLDGMMLERTLRSLSVVRFGSDICSVVHLISYMYVARTSLKDGLCLITLGVFSFWGVISDVS